MKRVIKHGLDKATAKKATESAFAVYTEKFSDYNPKVEWLTADHAKIAFAAKGLSVKGDFKLRDSELEVTMEVPFILKPFSGRAVKLVEDEIQVWVDKAKRGEV